MHRNDLIPSDSEAVTKSDSTAVNYVGLYIGGAGDVTVQSVEGSSVLYAGAPAGLIIPLRVVRVMSTGTTATNIVGFKA